MLLVTNDRGEYLVDPDAERTFGFDCSRLHRAEVRLAEHAWQLKQFNQLAVGRELRMVELKQEVNALANALGEKQPYDLTAIQEAAVRG